MKSRLATSIRCSFSYMNLGAHSGLHVNAVIVTACSLAQVLLPVSPAEARKAIQARVAMTRTQSRGCWLRNLYVQTPDRKTNTAGVYRCNLLPPVYLTRFDATVLTVEPRGNDWAALVLLRN